MFTFQNLEKDICLGYDSSCDYFLHAHRHVEFHYVKSGEFDVFYIDKWFHLTAGDMILLFPYHIHNTKKSNGMIYGAVFNLDLLEYFNNTLLTHACKNPIISKNATEKIYPLLKLAYNTYTEHPAFDYEIIISLLSSIIGNMLSELSNDLVKITTLPQDISILQYCTNNATEHDMSLDKISKQFHLSKPYISHMFAEKLGINFTEFINNQRLEQACKLLKYTNLSITEIQYSCGFISQATFNRIFKNKMHISPREYRNEK